jgi:hypothetical protein
MALDLARTRVLLFEQLSGSIPFPFLVVLAFWLGVIFASFGLRPQTARSSLPSLSVLSLFSGALF